MFIDDLKGAVDNYDAQIGKMKRVRRAILALFLLGGLCISGTASANWMCSQGNDAVVEYPANNSSSYYKGWGLDFSLKSGSHNYIHIPVSTGDSLRAGKIRFYIYTDSADAVIDEIAVYNGVWNKKTFTVNYGYGWKEAVLDLGGVVLFDRGLSITFHVKDKTATGAAHRFIFTSACADFVQY